jgi:hypothetical protein
MVPRDAVRITGEVKYHEVQGDSGQPIRRGFCPNCGSRLFGQPSGMPMALTGISLGSLDDPSLYKPTIDLFTSRAQPWDFMNPDLPKFPKMPPM